MARISSVAETLRRGEPAGRPPDLDERRKRPLEGKIRRRDRLGGLIHEYHRAAA